MSMMLNIPSYVQDDKYRYRMHRMNLKIESKGNGIKTNIVNLGEIAKDLRTDEQYLLKFFGFEKASLTTFKEAGGKNNTNYIINGEFNEEDMRKVLDRYIDKYICCPKCKLPEMHMLVIEGKITGKCDSCPFAGELDNKHKITAFILKNPPVAKNMATGKKEKKEEVIKVKDEKRKNDDGESTHVWHFAKFKGVDISFDSADLTALMTQLRAFMEDLKEVDFDIRSAEIVAQLKPLELKKAILSYLLFNAFFTVNIAKQAGEHTPLYRNLMKKLVIVNVEQETLINLQYLFLEANKKDWSRFMPTIMQNLLESEMFSHEFLVQYINKQLPDIEKSFLYSAVRDSEFREQAKPFLEWVIEPDEDEEDEKADSATKQNPPPQ